MPWACAFGQGCPDRRSIPALRISIHRNVNRNSSNDRIRVPLSSANARRSQRLCTHSCCSYAPRRSGFNTIGKTIICLVVIGARWTNRTENGCPTRGVEHQLFRNLISNWEQLIRVVRVGGRNRLAIRSPSNL